MLVALSLSRYWQHTCCSRLSQYVQHDVVAKKKKIILIYHCQLVVGGWQHMVLFGGLMLCSLLLSMLGYMDGHNMQAYRMVPKTN